MSAAAPVDGLLALVQLTHRARDADTIPALGFVIVNETLNLLAYRQAALWYSTGIPHVAAVSGLPQPEPGAPYVQWLERLFRELSTGEQTAHTLAATQLSPKLGEEWASWLPAHALYLPLNAPRGPHLGVLLLARDTPWSEHEVALASELTHAYAHALAAFEPRQRFLSRAREWSRTKRTHRRILLTALFVCFVPIRLSVLAPAEVVPRDAFLVRAPLDGVVDHFDVQPNQMVKAGTPLFSLDTSTLQTRNALARKAYDTAIEEYRQSAQLAVTDDKGRVELAQRRAALDEKSLELNYTAEQLARIQVKADRDGVVVFTDTNDWTGKAVSIGERILLLADPEKLELRIHLPVADQIDLKPGSSLSFYPKSSALTSYDARLINIAYRAEPTEDGILAYRIKAALSDDARPRLGQVGTARLRGQWVPLIYAVLRRPLSSVRQLIGW